MHTMYIMHRNPKQRQIITNYRSMNGHAAISILENWLRIKLESHAE